MRVYIFTRFSLRIPDFERRISLSEHKRTQWLRYRANIFNNVTLPCVERQVKKAHRHFLLMDEDDSWLFQKHINDHDALKPIFCKATRATEIVSNEILKSASGPVLVVRLDSDDLIADDYLEQLSSCCDAAPIYAQAERYGKVFIKARNGYNTDLRYIQRVFDDSPSFLATYYPKFVGELDLGGDHTKINRRNPVSCDTAEWARLIHGSNVANNFRPYRAQRISKSTWPAGIYKPDRNLLDEKISYTARGLTRKTSSRLKLHILAAPGGAPVVRAYRRIGSVLGNIYKYIIRK